MIATLIHWLGGVTREHAADLLEDAAGGLEEARAEVRRLRAALAHESVEQASAQSLATQQSHAIEELTRRASAAAWLDGRDLAAVEEAARYAGEHAGEVARIEHRAQTDRAELLRARRRIDELEGQLRDRHERPAFVLGPTNGIAAGRGE